MWGTTTCTTITVNTRDEGAARRDLTQARGISTTRQTTRSLNLFPQEKSRLLPEEYGMYQACTLIPARPLARLALVEPNVEPPRLRPKLRCLPGRQPI